MDADVLIAHNGITYDLPVLAKIAGVHLDVNKMIDTLVLSRLGNPERPGGHSMAAWGETFGIPKPVHEDWSQWSEDMAHRCTEDTKINVKTWERLQPMLEAMPEAVEIEHKVAISIHRMCEDGIYFDTTGGMQLLDDLMRETEAAREVIQLGLPYIYYPKHGFKVDGEAKSKVLKRDPNKAHWGRGILEGGVPYTEVGYRQLQIGSRMDMVRYLQDKYDWVPTQKTKGGQPQLNDEVLRAMPYPETQQLADYFKAEKVKGYLNGEPNKSGRGGGWLHHVTNEGKLHASFIPLTAVTGRPSCVAPNLQQVPTDTRVRQLFRPRPGWTMVGCDADGQELRCLGHYLSRYDEGDYGREVVNGDIHSRVQELIGFNSRSITKNVEYGMIYGAGNPKLGQIAQIDALSVGKTLKGDLGRIGGRIRKRLMEGIPALKKLIDDVQKKAKLTGKLKGLDGRTLWVRSPHSALNLVLQSSGIIHMKKAIAMMDQALLDVGLVRGEHYSLMLWVHDELQFECMPEHAELLGRTAAKVIEDAAVSLGFRVPMTGTYSIGSNWSETH
jgi:DNA polymerase-1